MLVENTRLSVFVVDLDAESIIPAGVHNLRIIRMIPTRSLLICAINLTAINTPLEDNRVKSFSAINGGLLGKKANGTLCLEKKGRGNYFEEFAARNLLLNAIP